MAEVAEGQRICRQVGNISAIFAKRASNVDEGQEKERYITNIESARKEIHTGCALQIHSFRDTPLAIHGRLKASVLSVRGILYQLAWSKANQQRSVLQRYLHQKSSRAPAFQAGCRGFESRLPLSCMNRLCAGRSEAVWEQPGGERASKEAVFPCAKTCPATSCLDFARHPAF